MRIALVADTFPPLRNSGAVQLRDLSREFVRQGHEVTVLLPSADISTAWTIEQMDGACVVRLKAPQTKNVGYVRRSLGELLMPFFMMHNLRRSPLARQKWDGIVWYSPSIFHGPLVNWLKRSSGCKAYLIIRDIFPEWAVDMGLMKRNGLPHRFFDAIARHQYSVANVIGVQTPGNLPYFARWSQGAGRCVEVLQNWLDAPGQFPCSIRISTTLLADRKVFVYAGNMGVAQGMDILLELAAKLQHRQDVGFLFVGRGSDAKRLEKKANQLQLNNVLFFDEIHPDEIPDLYAQCSVGIVALDPRHKSHNIPGKFLTYMQSGLPVLANVNIGNDLAKIIHKENVGKVSEANEASDLYHLAVELLDQLGDDSSMPQRCKNLYLKRFSVGSVASQIVQSYED
jgi:glycosyltransferase involved in cell wall biosynthesis